MNSIFLVVSSFHQGRYDDGDTPICWHEHEDEAIACLAKIASESEYLKENDKFWRLRKLSSDRALYVTEVERECKA